MVINQFDAPSLDPRRLRMLLAKRFDAQGDLPWEETDLGALLAAFRQERRTLLGCADDEQKREEIRDWKFTFAPGVYSLLEAPLPLVGNFSATCWAGADLSGTVAHGALWDEAEFVNGWLNERLVHTNCARMDFSGWQAGDYDQTGKDMFFSQVNLTQSIWRLCKVIDAIFDRCDLSGSDLRGGWFIECDFRSSDMHNVDCRGARFDRCFLPKAFNYPGAIVA